MYIVFSLSSLYFNEKDMRGGGGVPFNNNIFVPSKLNGLNNYSSGSC